jgi:hypothetical protein
MEIRFQSTFLRTTKRSLGSSTKVYNIVKYVPPITILICRKLDGLYRDRDRSLRTNRYRRQPCIEPVEVR